MTLVWFQDDFIRFHKSVKLTEGKEDSLSDKKEMGSNEKVEINKRLFQTIIKNHVGEIYQTPPSYSAKKINSIKLYDLARKDIFVKLKGNFDPQEDSHRVPRKIHKKALEVISQITKENRVDKKWNARDSEGEVLENMYLDEIDFSEGKWMILAQTNNLLEEIGEYFYGLGIRFTGKVNRALPNEILQAYQTWVKLNNGIRVDKEDAKAVYKQF